MNTHEKVKELEEQLRKMQVEVEYLMLQEAYYDQERKRRDEERVCVSSGTTSTAGNPSSGLLAGMIGVGVGLSLD